MDKRACWLAIGVAASLDFLANYLAQFFVHIGPVMDDGGTLTFAFSFVVYDYIRRTYGRRATIAAIVLGGLVSLLFALIPGNGGVGRITIASLLTLCVSGPTDYLMQTATIAWPVWRYVTACNAVSLAVDTVLFCYLAFDLPPAVRLPLMAGEYTNKMLVTICAIPLVYLARRWASRTAAMQRAA